MNVQFSTLWTPGLSQGVRPLEAHEATICTQETIEPFINHRLNF